jgi:hypothetical protein
MGGEKEGEVLGNEIWMAELVELMNLMMMTLVGLGR